MGGLWPNGYSLASMPATAPQSHGRPGQAVVVHGGRHRRPDGHAGEAHSIKRAIPDILSTCGLPQILSRVEGFSEELGQEVKPLGIVLTECQANSTVYRNTERQLRAKAEPTSF